MIFICSFLFILLIFLLLVFVCIPIRRVGVVKYILLLEDLTPLGKITRQLREKQMCRLSKAWFDKTSYLIESQIPKVNWIKDDPIDLCGTNAFYCLDQYSDDCRELLCSLYNFLPRERGSWRESFYTNNYVFRPDLSPNPKYRIEKTNDSLSIVAGDELNTWTYLPSKKEEGDIYALEFDYMPNIEMQETLQIDFCMTSLSKRLRFNLENNKTLKFDLVDRGCFVYWKQQKKWDKFKKPFSLPLNEYSKVRLEVIKDKYMIYFNNQLEMAIHLEGWYSLGKNWSLIFWNGTEKRGMLDISIKNFKILRPSSIINK